MEKKPFMILSFERVFQLTLAPSEDLPEDLTSAGYMMSQSDGRRKRPAGIINSINTIINRIDKAL